MSDGIKIKLGGEGEAITTTLTVEGSPCRMEDFTMWLVGAANGWIKEADKRERNDSARREAIAKASGSAPKASPCGCKGDA